MTNVFEKIIAVKKNTIKKYKNYYKIEYLKKKNISL